MTQFSTREVPWMKLGKLVDEPVTAAEAAKLGGLDWDAELRSTWYLGGGGQYKEVENRRTVVRLDTDEALSVVSGDYPILQYREAFEFIESVSPYFVAAGALRGGRQAFMVVKLPEHTHSDLLGGEDPHDFFVVLRTSHDRTRACEAMVMPLRGRCMNQLTLRSFSSGATHRWAIRHTSTMNQKLAEAKEALVNLGTYVDQFTATVERLAQIKITENAARSLLERVIRDTPKRDDKLDTILNLWNEAPTVGWSGTGWGLVNAVSEFYDWHRPSGSSESRFVAALEGETHKAVNRTAGLLLSRN